MDLQEAARNFICPTVNGQISTMYADAYTDSYYKKKYGEKIWKEACEKARTKYILGSVSVAKHV